MTKRHLFKTEKLKEVLVNVLHHKDRDRHNNDISNLEILCSNCHAIEHWGDAQST